MFSIKRGAGGGAGGGKKPAESRDEILAAARQERELRTGKRENSSFAITIQRHLRGFAVRARLARETVAALTTKLADISKLSTLLAAKGVKFVPPAAALQPLVSSLLPCQWAWRQARGLSPSAHAAIAGVYALLNQSSRVGGGCCSLAAAGAQYGAPAAGTTPGLATPVLTWKSLLHRAMGLAGLLVGRYDIPSGTRLMVCEWLHATVSASQPFSGDAVAYCAQLSFVHTCIRPAVLALPCDSTASRINATDADVNVCGRLYELALALASQQLHHSGGVVAGGGGGKVIGGMTNGDKLVSHADQVVVSLWSIPFLFARVLGKGSNTHPSVPPETLLALLSRVPLTRTHALSMWCEGMPPSAMGKATTGGTPSLRSSVSSKLTSTPATPGGAGVKVAPMYTYSPAACTLLAAWPPVLYLAANVIQLLSLDISTPPLESPPPPPTTSTTTSSTLAVPLPSAATGAPSTAAGGGTTSLPHSPPPAHPLRLVAHHLHPALMGVCLESVGDPLLRLPDDVWSAATPMVWITAGGIAGGGTSACGVGASPIPMPALLTAQLRVLSHEKLVRVLAKTCLAMQPAAFTHPRLRLEDSDDPERGSYDSYAHDVVVSGSGAYGSALAATPSLGTSLVRAAWETSKLALSFFRRKPAAAPAVATTATGIATSSISSDSAAATSSSSGGWGGKGAPAGGSGASNATTHSSTAAWAAAARSGGGHGGTTHSSVVASLGSQPFDSGAVKAFCRLFALFVAPRPLATPGASSADSDAIIGRRYILNTLAFTPTCDLIRHLWSYLLQTTDLGKFVQQRCYKSCAEPEGTFGVAALLATVFSHFMMVVDEFELYQQHTPLPLREIRHVVRFYRDALAHAEGIGVDKYASGVEALTRPATPFWPRFASAASGLLRALYDRHSQRPLGPTEMWIVDTSKVALHMSPPPGLPPGERFSDTGEANRRLLQVMPNAVPFDTRATLYWERRDADRRACQDGCPQVKVTVQRARLFDSAYTALQAVRGDSLKRKVYVSFINEEGLPESGIDAGGLFKELWTSLANIVFDASYGLFKTNEQGELYPNPDSALCTETSDDVSYEFIGMVLGKALYEGITIGPQFARFFLHKLLGRPVNLHHLPSLDPELYKNLMFVKTYEGDVFDLSLTFTVSGEMSANGEERPLVPGGASIPVTNKNRTQYIYLVADWRLNGAIERQCAAFLRGIRLIVPPAWLATFSAPELQVIISGAARGIDVGDLERHASYGAGFYSVHGTIGMFWKVVAEFSDRDKAALLKFVTSCERPPPAGFKQLQPPFTIHKLAAHRPNDVLPMASTCFNILKLPEYSDKATMKAKLLLAIHSGAGFELT